MIFRVHRAEHVTKAPASIVGYEKATVRSEQVQAIAILRIESNLAVIHRPRVDRRQLFPRIAAVGAPVHTAFAPGRFDRGVHDVRVHVRDVETDAPFVAFREALGEPGPRRATVATAEDSAAGAAAVESPRLPLPLVHRRVQDLGIARIDHQVGRARVLVQKENLLPCLAAVGRLEHPAFGVRSPQMSRGGDERDIGIARMNGDTTDVMRIGETDPFPRRAGVGRLVHAVAPRRALTIICLARPHPHDVRV